MKCSPPRCQDCLFNVWEHVDTDETWEAVRRVPRLPSLWENVPRGLGKHLDPERLSHLLSQVTLGSAAAAEGAWCDPPLLS